MGSGAGRCGIGTQAAAGTCNEPADQPQRSTHKQPTALAAPSPALAACHPCLFVQPCVVTTAGALEMGGAGGRGHSDALKEN